MTGSDLPDDGAPDGATTPGTPSGAARTAKVFLSYSRVDFAFVQALYGVLTPSAVIHPWLDVVELRGGGDWRAQIAESIDSSAFFVLVVSRNSLQSPQVLWEWERARGRGVPIVLVRIDAVRLPPQHVGFRVYDLRRRWGERGALLRADLETGRLRSVSAPTPWLPPAAVVLVMLGNVTVIAWLLHLWSVVPLTPVGAPLAVRSPWIGDFTVRWTDSGVACVAAASGLAVLLHLGCLYSVVRRRVDPLGLVCGLMSAALVVLVGDLYLLHTEVASAASTGLSSAPLWQHLLLQDAFLVVAIMSSRAIWRSPDFRVRAALGRVRRPEAEDGDANDLSAAQTDRNTGWVDRVLPEGLPGDRGEGRAGTVAVRHVPGEEALTRSIEALCRRLGLTTTDATPDHVVVLAGPRSDLSACVADATSDSAQAVFVLVESMVIDADTEQIRRHQWVDLRRQEVDSFRQLARALHAGVPGTTVPSPPLEPSRFSAPLVVMWMINVLIGQTVLGLQLVIVRLAIPPEPMLWRTLSVGAALVYCATGLVMGIALVRHWWTPPVFRWWTLVAVLSAVVVDVTLLRDANSIVLTGFVVALALLQFLAHSGCLVVSHSSWTARPAPGAGIATVARTFWPSVAVGVVLILLVTALVLGVAPGAG